MLTLDAPLFREFIGETWTLEGRREGGSIYAYATRVTAQTWTLGPDGNFDKPGLPNYVQKKLRRLVDETKNNAGFFDCHIVYFDYLFSEDEIGDDIKYVKGVRSVYLYDANRIVHCAELTGSYELHHLYESIIFQDGDFIMDDDTVSDLSEKYEHSYSGEPVEYHHVSSIRRLPSNRYHRIGGFAIEYNDWGTDEDGSVQIVHADDDADNYEDVLEHLCDKYRGNHVF